MSDLYYVTYTIGGPVPHRLLKEIYAIVDEENLDRPMAKTKEEFIEYVEGIDRQKALIITGEVTNYDDIEILSEFCFENKIVYIKRSFSVFNIAILNRRSSDIVNKFLICGTMIKLTNGQIKIEI